MSVNIQVNLKRKGAANWEPLGLRSFAAIPREGEFIDLEEPSFNQDPSGPDIPGTKCTCFRVMAFHHPLKLDGAAHNAGDLYILEAGPFQEVRRNHGNVIILMPDNGRDPRP